MPESELKRGINALLRWRRRTGRYDVVYVGMARQSAKARLRAHARSARKGDLWTHFSIIEVFDNIRGEELEGLLRHIYRQDTTANRLNAQRGFTKLRRVRSRRLDDWWA